MRSEVGRKCRFELANLHRPRRLAHSAFGGRSPEIAATREGLDGEAEIHKVFLLVGQSSSIGSYRSAPPTRQAQMLPMPGAQQEERDGSAHAGGNLRRSRNQRLFAR
jgi:hypothetical protein